MKYIIHSINKKKNKIYKINTIIIASVLLSTTTTYSQDKTYVAPDVNIISVTPVQGSGLSIDRVPGKVQSISRETIGKKKNSWNSF